VPGSSLGAIFNPMEDKLMLLKTGLRRAWLLFLMAMATRNEISFQCTYKFLTLEKIRHQDTKVPEADAMTTTTFLTSRLLRTKLTFSEMNSLRKMGTIIVTNGP
jgi:hypothetical protein